jgi:transcriptional regulator with XRE-family HTH domain
MTFAEKLRELRVAAGLTQQQLADHSRHSLPTVRSYEQGHREPLLSTAFRLARALGVSVEAFAECVEQDAVPVPPRKAAGLAGAKKGRSRKGK